MCVFPNAVPSSRLIRLYLTYYIVLRMYIRDRGPQLHEQTRWQEVAQGSRPIVSYSFLALRIPACRLQHLRSSTSGKMANGGPQVHIFGSIIGTNLWAACSTCSTR